MILNHIELAWAAGFFDGEGHISFRTDSRGQRKVILAVSQIEPVTLERFKAALGVGKVYLHSSTRSGKPWYMFRLQKYADVQLAVCLLWNCLSPVKQKQAHAALLSYIRVRPRMYIRT